MERGMQFPPYLYELFKRVKSIVVPEFLLCDFFFHVKSCPISGSVADPALTGTRATTLFSNIVPTFCRLGILSIQKLLYFSLSNFRFGCRPSPYRYLQGRATTLFSKIVPNFCRLGIILIQKLLCFSLFNFRFGCRPSPYRQLEKNLCILVPWIVSKKQSPKKAQKDFTKVKKRLGFDHVILISWS